ncbi:unnamed protein product [Parascedosporium putredinis]|uniref:Putative ER transporter 6TM N-terminal domain-containing protein n=1 Tax=Parascedosporium putredinis TaxID=1442378 RepID=A0A9P1H5B6_9PEZI|nr:unnamed protein product [Parascedosporium putredinis]CAI7996353.1 unnamed protein product [Parascedosporium putredinis]
MDEPPTETRTSRARWLNPKTWWSALDMDVETLLKMMKGALPPVLCIAIFQADSFLKILSLCLIATALSFALCCLAIFCADKARQGNSAATVQGPYFTYNPDAAAVCGVFLFFMIWYSSYQDPGVCFSLLAVVVLTRASSVATFTEGLDFMWRITKAFLLGFAMATGVSLFILPSTSRGAVFATTQAYVAQAQIALDALVDFVNETPDDVLLATPALLDAELEPVETVQTLRTAVDTDSIGAVRQKIAQALGALNALDAQMQTNLGYAKIEVAWGRLSAADLERWPTHVLDELAQLTRVGLQYFLNELQVSPAPWSQFHHAKPKTSQPDGIELEDVDGASVHLDPTSPTFLDDFTRCLKDLSRRKRAIEQLVKHSEEVDGRAEDFSGIQHEYCLALYLFYMEDLVANSVYSLVSFAKSKVDDGTMSRSRLIYPTFLEYYRHDGEPREEEEESSVYSNCSVPREFQDGATVTDPIHLIPTHFWERWAGKLGKVARFLGSDLSMFGLRVAAASLCLGIVALLQDSQEFLSANAFYIYVKMPKYFGTSVIAIITLNVAIGYEVNADKLGHEASEANGQPYYPLYLFSPYKFFAVAIGCAVSFIWVIFPYPITAKSRPPRRDRGETIRSVVYPQEQLQAISLDLYKKQLRAPAGGKFPIRPYEGMISATQQSLNIITLMAYIGRTMSSETSRSSTSDGTELADPADGTSGWVSNLAAAALESTDFQSHSTTALLCHLGAAMMSSQPLPPFLGVSESFPLAKQLRRLNDELLHIRNARYPAFVAFIALEVLKTTFNKELKILLE